MKLAVLALTCAARAVVAQGDVAFPRPADFLHVPRAGAAPVVFALSRTLGDSMVLQRDRPSMVWGFAPVGASVKTVFAGTTFTSTAGADTVWRQALPATAATATGQTLTFSASTGGTASLSDVLFGDVRGWGAHPPHTPHHTVATYRRPPFLSPPACH